MKHVLIAAFLVGFFSFADAQNAVPPFPGIRLQGTLTDNSGNLVTGSHNVTVRIFKHPTTGVPIYTEVYNNLVFTNGIVDVLVAAASLPYDSAYYIETQLDNEVFSPRTQLASTPYALHAFKADTSGYAKAAPPVGNAGGVLTGAYPNPTLADSSIQFGKIAQNGAAPGQVMKWNGTAWIPANDSSIGGLFLPLSGGVMTGGITNVGNPPITMGKGNFGENNTNTGLNAFVAGYTSSATGNSSAVGGGEYNKAQGVYSTVGGGVSNDAYNAVSFVGGGSDNRSRGVGASIAGGVLNEATGDYSSVSGGYSNYARGFGAFIGGGGGGYYSDSNSAIGDYSVITGGKHNLASAVLSTISGGDSNSITAQYTTISGGRGNSIGGFGSSIGGGVHNTTGGSGYARVGGGYGNSILSGSGGVVGGGEGNQLSAQYAGIAGGYHNYIGGSGSFGQYSNVAGGSNNSIAGDWSAVGGGSFNMAGSTYLTLRTSYATVSGGRDNQAGGEGSTVSGGVGNNAGGVNYPQTVSNYSTVGGGQGNLAQGNHSFVGGGKGNVSGGVVYPDIIGTGAAISGGINNLAFSDYSFVGGGFSDSARGKYSVVPGGLANVSAGDYSFACGQQAKARHNGAFVWADNSDLDFASDAINQFAVRATGGAKIYSSTDLSAGVTLAPGASAWSSVSDSTMKRNARIVDGVEILDKLDRLPVKQWSYKAQDPSIEHIGPMAQDFRSIFGLGENDKTISTIDPSGIALAAIKELHRNNLRLEKENQELWKEITILKELISQSASK